MLITTLFPSSSLTLWTLIGRFLSWISVFWIIIFYTLGMIFMVRAILYYRSVIISWKRMVVVPIIFLILLLLSTYLFPSSSLTLSVLLDIILIFLLLPIFSSIYIYFLTYYFWKKDKENSSFLKGNRLARKASIFFLVGIIGFLVIYILSSEIQYF